MMERLTTRSLIGGWTLKVPRQEAVDLLAAYENTGSKPEEIKSALDADAIIKLCAQALGVSADRLRELAAADRDGRAVVLDGPRKPLVWGDAEHDTVLCPYCGEDLIGIPYGEKEAINCPYCGEYIDGSKAITRTEAEAAIGE